MSILPWDNWICHLDKYRDEVNSVHNDLVTAQNKVQDSITLLNSQLVDYSTLVFNNATLLIIKAITPMSPLDLKNFKAATESVPTPTNWEGYAAVKGVVISFEVVLGLALAKVLWNMRAVANALRYQRVPTSESASEVELSSRAEVLGSASNIGSVPNLVGQELRYRGPKPVIENTGDSLADSQAESDEEAVVAIQGSSTARIVATGVVGIFVFLGLDILFGYLNASASEKILKDTIAKLKAKLTLVQTYIDTINGQSTKLATDTVYQMNTFKLVCDSLNNIYPVAHKPGFSWNIESKIQNLKAFLAAQQEALNYFSLMVNLRTTYAAALARNPVVSKDQVVNAVLITAPVWVDINLLDNIYDIMLKYSLESSSWSTKVENYSPWQVTIGSVTVRPDNADETVSIPYSSSGVLINVDGHGSILLSDNPDLQDDGNLRVYSIHVSSGSFETNLFPDTNNNAMYVKINPNGTFDIRPGVNQIPIGHHVDDQYVILANAASIFTVPHRSNYNVGVLDISIQVQYNTSGAAKLFSKIDPDPTGAGIVLEVTSDGKVHFRVTSHGTTYEIVSPSSPVFGEWHQATGVRNAGRLTLFIDGKNVATQLWAALAAVQLNIPTAITLGGNGPFSIGDVALWDITLWEEPIKATMFTQLSGVEVGLIGYWSLNGDFLDSTTLNNNAVASGTTTFYPLLHCFYVSGGTNDFSYLSFEAVHSKATPDQENIVRKQSVVVGSPPFLYATLSKAGDSVEYPVGVSVTITDPSGNHFTTVANTNNLFVQLHQGNFQALIVKAPVSGTWVFECSAPAGISFVFSMQTNPSANITTTIQEQLQSLYASDAIAHLPNIANSKGNRVSLLAALAFTRAAFIYDPSLYAGVPLAAGLVSSLFGSATTDDFAKAFLTTLHTRDLLENARVVVDQASLNPGPATTVYVWSYKGSLEAWGHASLSLSNGTHISWWPSDTPNEFFPVLVQKMSALTGTFEAPAFRTPTLDKDVEYEGVGPDVIVRIYTLDETKIQTWWNTFRPTHNWRTLDQNCSTTAYNALYAGGAATILSDYEKLNFRSVVVWTPYYVEQLAQSLAAYNQEPPETSV